MNSSNLPYSIIFPVAPGRLCSAFALATFLGVALGLCWPVGLACCLTWLATAKILKISSLSALVATASSLIWLAVFEQPQMLTVFVILVLLVFERHRDNIVRLKAGTEPKIGQ